MSICRGLIDKARAAPGQRACWDGDTYKTVGVRQNITRISSKSTVDGIFEEIADKSLDDDEGNSQLGCRKMRAKKFSLKKPRVNNGTRPWTSNRHSRYRC